MGVIMRLAAFMAIMICAGVSADFNLYISRKEMNRTLGVSAEMSYAENGIVSSYSTKFPYRVASNITHLQFTWNSPTRAHYTVQVTAEDFNVLPSVSLPASGRIPVYRETFNVEYRCAGSRAGQFVVTLHFNISYPSKEEPTIFTLKQEKICASRDGRRALAGNTESEYTNLFTTETSSTLFSLPLLTVSVGFMTILILVIIGAVCFYTRSKKKQSNRFYGSPSRSMRSPMNFSHKDHSVFEALNQPFLHPTTSTPLSKVSTVSTSEASTSKDPRVIFERKNQVDVRRTLVELYADRNLFQMIPVIELEGKFGEIRWAVWRQNQVGLSGDIDDEEDGVNEEVAVICKTLKHSTDRSHFERFIAEALVFHQVPAHINLAQVIGAATFGHFNNPESVTDLPLICYRHQGFGFLKKFLLTCRGVQALGTPEATSKKHQTGPNQTLRTHDLVHMSVQVIKAISHLHKFGIIHKDVATRNCLIAEIPALGINDRLMVQLCDASLSRDLWPDDYYTSDVDDTQSRPVKWMPPETIRSNVYNSASDVWSFGVFIWELFTCGQQPFGECNPEEMTSILQTGTRLGQPYNCPDELYQIMYSCWNAAPLDRPTTAQLQQQLEDFGQQLRKYI